MDAQTLLEAAIGVRGNAHAPYSGFLVGAAIRTRDGRIFAGCNVENVAYPEGPCAEAGAIAAMVAAGAREIVEVLVIADSDPPVTPCGGCRQKLAEFGTADAPVHLAATGGIRATTPIGALLPGAFGSVHLESAGT